MKTYTYLLLIFFSYHLIFAQSSMVFDSGTNIEVSTGADICADIITINGTYSGAGTLCNGPLPVELAAFTASVEYNVVCLNWKTETEVSNFGFEIERAVVNTKSKKQDVEFSKIGFVEGNGNSNSPKDYSFKDEKPFGSSKFQYRLKQIDTDGQFEYSDIIEIEIVPAKFELFQNYPNPFNLTTTIRFQLPEESKVVIKIYDILGAELKTILNEKKEAGIYEFVFNASELPSGIYIYRLITDRFMETKKMILLK